MGLQTELQALFTLHGVVSLIILAALELILGVDNIIFISLLITKLPEQKRLEARVTGLSLAFVMRIIMLFCIVWLSRITTTLFMVSNFQVSIKDVLFFVGGSYLVFNTIKEIIEHINSNKEIRNIPNKFHTYKSIILQIVVVDILFSFDSIFTAIGLVPNFIIMVLAIGIGMVFMIYVSGKISNFIEKYPAVKTLALSFIAGIGLLLILQAFHIELPKSYLYIAFTITLIVEGIYIRLKKKK